MADEKPKHKPQKKRTLEEVLKSLQDLIRNDLVSAQPARPTWRESGREGGDPNAVGDEPDTFHKALFKLDQIINEKIIEPVERAQQTPPEPLLPDEEIEIEWEMDQTVADDAADRSQGDIAVEDLAALDRASASLDVNEIPPFESPLDQPRNEHEAIPPLEPELQEPSIDVTSEAAESEPAVEVLEAEPVGLVDESQPESIEIEGAPPPEPIIEESIDLAPAPEMDAEPDLQQTFDFSAPAPAPTVAPSAPTPSETAPATGAPSERGSVPKVRPTLELVEDWKAPSSNDLMIVDLSEDVVSTAEKPKGPPEQPPSHPVETSSTRNTDAYTVEFSVEPTPPAAAAEPAPPESTTEPAVATQTDTSATDDTQQPPEDSAVKEKTPSSDSEKTPANPPEGKSVIPAPPESAGAPEEIPVLSEIAHISAPAAPPLPAAAQARDIAIRVIAKLNIERRKSGEKPLDIKTIERLQQYLADALNKRALNKRK